MGEANADRVDGDTPVTARLVRQCARGVAIARVIAERFGRHRMPTHAAALAYRGTLALFPFLVLVFGLVHAVGLDAIATTLTERAAAGQADDRGAFARWIGARIEEPPDTGLLSIGVLTALWAVGGGIRGLRLALAEASDEPMDGSTIPLWRRVVLSLAIAPVAVVAIVVAAVSLLVTSRAIGTVAGWLGASTALAELLTWLRIPMALVVIALLLAVVYGLAPRRRQPFRSRLPGAVLASVSWTLMSLGFSVALSTVLDYGVTYGSFGAAITLLVYLYLSAIVLLAGAEVNAVLAADR
jgi:membrane protein